MSDQVDEALAPIPPGEVLATQFLRPARIRPTMLARDLAVPVNRITDILSARRRITAQTALLLAKYFRTSPEFWMRLQMEYDLRTARRDRSTRARLLAVKANLRVEPRVSPMKR
mgnify:CR=1 FL=1